MKVAFLGGALGVLVAASTVWAAGTMSPQQIVDDRVNGMEAMGKGLTAAKTATDAATAKAELVKAIAFAKAIPDKFPKGTASGDPGVTKTRALPDVWAKPAEFKAAADALAVALQAASDAAGDTAKFETAMGGVFKTCKGCHDAFRTKSETK